jgi:uncharacterized coiled-coil protein SlyX
MTSPRPAFVLGAGGMDDVSSINTRQINVMSNQLFEQTARITQLQEQVAILGTRLQHTQVHLSNVDARVPSFATITSVLQMLVAKINEVILMTRGPSPEEASAMLADLEVINMELGMATGNGANCGCDYNSLCDRCFN